MARRIHPKSEIESALQYVEENGWRVDIGGSDAWGKIYCPDIVDRSLIGRNPCWCSLPKVIESRQ